MRNQITTIILCCLLAITTKGYSQDVIFLHHSTGAGVYFAGNVASWITSYNTANNKSIRLVERNFPNESIWGNYPYDYWKLWINGSCNSGDPQIECLNTLAANYDLVIFKHCFPGSAILPSNGNPDVSSSAQTIDNYKLQYRALRNLMDSYPTTKFMVWTLAPLHRLETTVEAAKRAYEFVQWVKNEWLVEDGKSHSNIIIFDFFSLVAELNENPTNGVKYCLKYDYEISHTILDSHPNTTANQYVGPIFAQAIANAFTTTSSIPVTNISVTGTGGATTITTDNGTLQLSASVLPTNASNNSVTWSFSNVAGQATISSTGLVTAITNGTVTARATANDGSGVSGYLTITISNQVIPVTGITVTGAGGATTITSHNGTLQLSASVLPTNASNNSVTWSFSNVAGQATISSAGLVTAINNGIVTARATANDGSGVSGYLTITISNQVIPVSSITVTGAGGASVIPAIGGTLQLYASVLPANATSKEITWSINNGTGQASINSSGIVTALDDGTVTAKATAKDGSGVTGTLEITISSQVVPVSSIVVNGSGGATTITTDGGTLQLSSAILPANATNKNVTWSITNNTGQATISTFGLVTAVDNGTVTVKANANDGSGVYGLLVLTLSNQITPVSSITVTGAGNISTITNDGGTLQLSASVLPSNTTNKNVDWSISNGTGLATVNSSGLVTAIDNGTVTAKASANDGSGVYGTLELTLSNQYIPVSNITVTGAGGVNTITNGGALQLNAAVYPENATNKTVTWSVVNGTGQATISSSGLMTSIAEGAVTARATANDGSSIDGTLDIIILKHITVVESIEVYTSGNVTPVININKGTLQMVAEIIPEIASIQSVKWSIENHTGTASIDDNGIVTALSDGWIKVIAAATDGSNVSGYCTVAILNQSSVTNLNENVYQKFNVSQAGNKLLIISDFQNIEVDYYSVYTIQGILMQRAKITKETVEIDVSFYIPGIYIVSLSNSQQVYPLKVAIH
jgi:uncharacterized protein YjdB